MEQKLIKRCYDKWICNLIYGGIKKDEYQKIKQEVLEKNRGSLSMASGCLTLMFAGLFMGSFISSMMEPNRLAYGIVGICFLVIRLLCGVMKKKGNRFIMFLWYVAMTLMITYAIILNTVIRRDISATTYCIIMITAPLLITDMPLRVSGYFLLATCCFAFVDFHQKEYYLAFTDTVNALCCIFLGSAIHLTVIRTKLREILQRKKIETERDTDKLTGCLTKAAFERKMTERKDGGEKNGVLFVMDLDYFKSINDNFGHVFGDMVLRIMGEALRQSFPESAMCGRFGGDEFQVWLPGRYNRKELILFLDELLSKIRMIKTPDESIQVTASIGAAVWPDDGEKYRTLFENADAALYSAKKLGRDRYVFCPKMKTRDRG